MDSNARKTVMKITKSQRNSKSNTPFTSLIFKILSPWKPFLMQHVTMKSTKHGCKRQASTIFGERLQKESSLEIYHTGMVKIAVLFLNVVHTDFTPFPEKSMHSTDFLQIRQIYKNSKECQSSFLLFSFIFILYSSILFLVTSWSVLGAKKKLNKFNEPCFENFRQKYYITLHSVTIYIRNW